MALVTPTSPTAPAVPSGYSSLSIARWGIVAVFLILLYGETLAGLAADWWNDSAASFGLLIPPIALYTAWMMRPRWEATPAREDGRGLGVVLAGCVLFLAAWLGAEFFVARVSFLLVLAGIVWTFEGFGRLKVLAFPFLLLFTAIPLPQLIYNRIAIPLQLFASTTSTYLIQAVGGTVYRDGNIIHLPGISLGVAEACSGLSSLNSLIVAALLVGFLFCRRMVTRVLLVVLAVPLAIGVNVLRIAGTALLATYREELAMGYYHSFGGWLVFVASFGLLLLLARILRWRLE